MAIGTPTVLTQDRFSSGGGGDTASFTPPANALLLYFQNTWNDQTGTVALSGHADANGWATVIDAKTTTRGGWTVLAAKSTASPSAGVLTMTTTDISGDYYVVAIPITGGAFTAASVIAQSIFSHPDASHGFGEFWGVDLATAPAASSISLLAVDRGTTNAATPTGTYLGSPNVAPSFQSQSTLQYADPALQSQHETTGVNRTYYAVALEITDPEGAAPVINDVDGDNEIQQGQTDIVINASNLPASVTSLNNIVVGGTSDGSTITGGTAMLNQRWNSGNPMFDAPAGLALGTSFEVHVDYTE